MALSDKQKKAIEIAMGSKAGDNSVSSAVAGVVKASELAVIPTPASATAEDCANKINAMINALKG